MSWADGISDEDKVTTFTIVQSSGSTNPGSPTVRPDRDYQREAIDRVLYDWSSGKKSVLIVLPTGAGKTIVSADIIRRVVQQTSRRAIFLAHRNELVFQTQDTIRLVSPQTTVGIVQGKRNEVGRQVTVASISTVERQERLRDVLLHGPYELIVCDEAHHATSKSWMRVINSFRENNPDTRILGLTATPGRADGIGLDSLFECISFSKSTLELIDEGWLVYPRAYRVKLDIDLDQVSTGDSDFGKDLKDGDLNKLMIQKPVLEAVLAAYKKHGENRTMIGFAVSVEHAKLLSETFSQNGIPATFVSGKTKEEDRKKTYARFRSGEIRMLFSCGVLTEGFDEPSAGGVLLARPTMSQSLFIQMVGRGLRLFPTKRDCIVIDCAGNTKKHPIVQMSTLSGFERFDETENKNDTPVPREKGEAPIATGASLSAEQIRLTNVRESTRESRYVWRKTDYGFVLQIPKIGYYLVSTEKSDPTHASIRYYDTRRTEDGRPAKAVAITNQPVDVELAYGLVESEAQRIVRALSGNSKAARSTTTPPSQGRLTFELHVSKSVENYESILDDGIQEEIVDQHVLMARSAEWRKKPRTPAQTKCLSNLGVKPENMPSNAGEASDLISVLSVERHQRLIKMDSEPATPKQRWYLRINQIPHEPSISKAEAKKLIYKHRVMEKAKSM